MKDIKKLIEGYKNFYQHYFVENADIYQDLARNGQSPLAAVIACSDSRADPLLITGAEPGELFVIRNVANLVPPFQDDNNATYHGTSAALEFGVNNLNIKNVIVFGHSKCAGIRALIEGEVEDAHRSFVGSWVQIAKDVKLDIEAEHGHLNKDVQAHICERKAIEKSLRNLTTFPWIAEKVKNGELVLHGWYFDIDHGELLKFNEMDGNWNKIVNHDEDIITKRRNIFAELIHKQASIFIKLKKLYKVVKDKVQEFIKNLDQTKAP